MACPRTRTHSRLTSTGFSENSANSLSHRLPRRREAAWQRRSSIIIAVRLRHSISTPTQHRGPASSRIASREPVIGGHAGPCVACSPLMGVTSKGSQRERICSAANLRPPTAGLDVGESFGAVVRDARRAWRRSGRGVSALAIDPDKHAADDETPSGRKTGPPPLSWTMGSVIEIWPSSHRRCADGLNSYSPSQLSVSSFRCQPQKITTLTHCDSGPGQDRLSGELAPGFPLEKATTSPRTSLWHLLEDN